MAEDPLGKLARLVGGVALMQGGLGHQVLGQMLIAGTSRLAVAGAAVMVAGTMRVKHPGAQFAIRTAAPAIALQTIFAQREELVERRERELVQREKALGSTAVLADRNRALADALGQERDAIAALRSDMAELRYANAHCLVEKSILKTRSRQLREERDALQARLAELGAAAAPAWSVPPGDPDLKAKRKRSARRAANPKRKAKKPKR
jgi:hypothetical protein